MFYIKSSQKLPILATFAPNKGIKIQASAINQDLGNSFSKFIVEQKDPRFVYAIARAVTADVPNKNWDFFPLEEIKKSYQTFIGRNIFLDHNTASVRNAVGKIIAAELREDEQGQTYVACLFKVDRQIHPDIAMKIENGIIDSVSMGSNVQEAQCSICGQRAHREAEFCVHMRNLGQYPDYEHGTMNYSINRGLDFTELSLVSVPADPTAKMHKVFNQSANLSKTAEGPDQTMAESPNTPTQTAAEDIKLTPEDNKRYVVDIPDVMKNGRPDADVPNQTTTLIEPVNKDTGFYQIDAASTEAADLLYNIMEAHTNKGVDDIGLVGKSIKILFSPDVTNPERFVADAVAVFGMALGHGVVMPAEVTAAYNAYIKKEAATNSNWTILDEDADFMTRNLGPVHLSVRPNWSTKKHAKPILKITLSFDDLNNPDMVDALKENLSVSFAKGNPVNKGKAANTLVISYPFDYSQEKAKSLDDTDRAMAIRPIVKSLKRNIDQFNTPEEVRKNTQDIKDFQKEQELPNSIDLEIEVVTKRLYQDPKKIAAFAQSTYDKYTKEGGPEQGLKALRFLKNIPEINKDFDCLLAIDEIYVAKEKEFEAQNKEDKAKSENLPEAEKSEVANQVVNQVAPAVEEVKQELPPQEAEKTLEQAKQQAADPVVEQAVDELDNGKTKQEVKKDLIELIDQRAEIDAQATVEAANNAATAMEQALYGPKTGQEGTEVKPDGTDPGLEQKPKEEPKSAQNIKPTPELAEVIKNTLLYGSGSRASEPERAIIHDPNAGMYLHNLRQRAIEPDSSALDQELNEMFKGTHPRIVTPLKAMVKAIYKAHYNDMDAYLDKCLGKDWQSGVNKDLFTTPEQTEEPAAKPAQEPTQPGQEPEQGKESDIPQFATDTPIGKDNPMGDFASWMIHYMENVVWDKKEADEDLISSNLATAVRNMLSKMPGKDANDVLYSNEFKKQLAIILQTNKGWDKNEAAAHVDPIIDAAASKLKDTTPNAGKEEPVSQNKLNEEQIDAIYEAFKAQIEEVKKQTGGKLSEDPIPYGTLFGSFMRQLLPSQDKNMAQQVIEAKLNDILLLLNRPGREKETTKYVEAFKQAALNAYNPAQDKTIPKMDQEAEGVTKDQVPGDAKVVDANGKDEEGTHYNTETTGAFEAGGWKFTLVGEENSELKPIKVYVRKYRKIKDPDKGKVVETLPGGQADQYEEIYQIKDAYRDNDVIKLMHIYRQAYQAQAFMAKDTPDFDVALTYHAINTNPIYGGSEEQPAEYTMTFSRKANTDGYDYDVSGTHVKGLTGHADSMISALTKIFKAVYYSANKAGDMTDTYNEEAASVVFKYEPIGVDVQAFLDPKQPMDTIVREIHLVVNKPNTEPKDTVVAHYSIAKTMPAEVYESPFATKEASANYMLHITAAEETEPTPEQDPNSDQDQTKDQTTTQGPDQGPDPEAGNEEETQPKATENKTSMPVYHIAIKAVPEFEAIIKDEDVVEKDQRAMLDYLTSPDGLRAHLLSWERAVRKGIDQYSVQQVKKNKKVDNVGVSAQQTEHSAGFRFVGINK